MSEHQYDPNDRHEKHDRNAYLGAVESQLRILERQKADGELREGIVETPRRVTKMWLEELTRGYTADIDAILKTFPGDEFDGQVILKDIPLFSMCEHHLMPFSGVCHIGYFPKDRVVGLSKLPRLVDAFARRLQIQERLTHQIMMAIQDHLKPRGTIVVVEAEHLCMTVRGVQAPGTLTRTCSVRGHYRDVEEQAKDEFLALLK